MSEPEDEEPHAFRKGGYCPVRIGEIFSNRYVVVRKLGWGHFSTVWFCFDKKTQSFVALKIVKSDPTYSAAALDEIKLLKTINAGDQKYRQPVCHLLDSFTISGQFGRHICMVFEVLGPNLLTLIKLYNYRGIPLPIVKLISRQILEGLDYLHRELKIIHTDLKPENVLLNWPIMLKKEKEKTKIQKKKAFIKEERVSNTKSKSSEENAALNALAAKMGIKQTIKLASESDESEDEDEGSSSSRSSSGESEDEIKKTIRENPEASHKKNTGKSQTETSSFLIDAEDFEFSAQFAQTANGNEVFLGNVARPQSISSEANSNSDFSAPSSSSQSPEPAAAKASDLHSVPLSHSLLKKQAQPPSLSNQCSQCTQCSQHSAAAVIPRGLRKYDVKIADFGNGCYTFKHFTTHIQTREYRSPEAIFEADYDTSCDIWSFGCMVFELLTGDYLFKPEESKSLSQDEDHLSLMIELLGPIPWGVSKRGRRGQQLMDRDGQLKRRRSKKPAGRSSPTRLASAAGGAGGAMGKKQPMTKAQREAEAEAQREREELMESARRADGYGDGDGDRAAGSITNRKEKGGRVVKSESGSSGGKRGEREKEGGWWATAQESELARNRLVALDDAAQQKDERRWPLFSVLREKYDFLPDEAASAAAFILRCLRYHPAERATAQELLRDSWLRQEGEWEEQMEEEIKRMRKRMKECGGEKNTEASHSVQCSRDSCSSNSNSLAEGGLCSAEEKKHLIDKTDKQKQNKEAESNTQFVETCLDAADCNEQNAEKEKQSDSTNELKREETKFKEGKGEEEKSSLLSQSQMQKKANLSIDYPSLTPPRRSAISFSNEQLSPSGSSLCTPPSSPAFVSPKGRQSPLFFSSPSPVLSSPSASSPSAFASSPSALASSPSSSSSSSSSSSFSSQSASKELWSSLTQHLQRVWIWCRDSVDGSDWAEIALFGPTDLFGGGTRRLTEYEMCMFGKSLWLNVIGERAQTLKIAGWMREDGEKAEGKENEGKEQVLSQMNGKEEEEKKGIKKGKQEGKKEKAQKKGKEAQANDENEREEEKNESAFEIATGPKRGRNQEKGSSTQKKAPKENAPLSDRELTFLFPPFAEEPPELTEEEAQKVQEAISRLSRAISSREEQCRYENEEYEREKQREKEAEDDECPKGLVKRDGYLAEKTDDDRSVASYVNESDVDVWDLGELMSVLKESTGLHHSFGSLAHKKNKKSKKEQKGKKEAVVDSGDKKQIKPKKAKIGSKAQVSEGSTKKSIVKSISPEREKTNDAKVPMVQVKKAENSLTVTQPDTKQKEELSAVSSKQARKRAKRKEKKTKQKMDQMKNQEISDGEDEKEGQSDVVPTVLETDL
ncbi:putative Serine threonine protein kinase-related domain containing protein [Monocercomonoides exilis]|uniref:putative Serine threonine protein kinase-related domain containing protein n=1 Tax=Monocercomonoides exilis TaxID=2049356 RepID=UPI003559DECC|nr:putative Serine threonine protein kinase-related domain containing protein [Monocercomonoides exilis]